MVSSIGRTSRLTLLAGALAMLPGHAAASSLIPHRAVYDLTLADVEDRSGISGIDGRMVYELNGSDCDGYTVSFRFVTRIDTEEFSRVTDQQTTTYEDLNTGIFRFVTRSFVDDALDSETSGHARLDDNGAIAVELDKPGERQLTLDHGKFPTEHMLELIEKAKAGERFYQSHIYDGSEEGDKVMLTTTVVGEKQAPSGDDMEAEQAAEFSGTEFWPVTMAYFNEDDSGDETPDYQISFKLYDSGVTRDLMMNYGEFTLRGTLADLEVFEKADCSE